MAARSVVQLCSGGGELKGVRVRIIGLDPGIRFMFSAHATDGARSVKVQTGAVALGRGSVAAA